MSRLMVLGGSTAQLGAIRAAREMGHHVIVADRDPQVAGATEAHEFIRASTFDEDEVFDATRDSRANGILVVATDQPVLVAARVSDRLGLPYHVSPRVALLVTNKARMKERLSSAAIPTPRFKVVPGAEAERVTNLSVPTRPNAASGLAMPVVVKPVDNQGQRGVSLCRRETEVAPAIAAARAFSREDCVLVEEHYDSTEVTVSGWVTGGRLAILAVTDRVTITSDTSLGVCAAHRFPGQYAGGGSGSGGLLMRIAELAREVVCAFAIERGPVYVQMLIGRKGVMVNEVAARVGGAFEELSIPSVTGVNILHRAIAEDLGLPLAAIPAEVSGFVRTAGAFTAMLLYCRPGTIKTVSDLSTLRQQPGVLGAGWFREPGYEVGQMRDSSQRVGYAVVHGDSPAEVNAMVTRAWHFLSVRSAAGEEMLIDTLGLSLH